eukprot:CAMPEP_0175149286 /NCGR_PEP_ID=MMETSP0087-20121206/17154_1 /TAXON_ID=136419 /ORGANISM="Unknown Unknown, Strain D1" /LENGTH=155 /DNA_ID=CAMNT_0016434951 /DNA_START=36 /DNA_END=500 /DNA_ORIENTATION=+
MEELLKLTEHRLVAVEAQHHQQQLQEVVSSLLADKAAAAAKIHSQQQEVDELRRAFSEQLSLFEKHTRTLQAKHEAELLKRANDREAEQVRALALRCGQLAACTRALVCAYIPAKARLQDVLQQRDFLAAQQRRFWKLQTDCQALRDAMAHGSVW